MGYDLTTADSRLRNAHPEQPSNHHPNPGTHQSGSSPHRQHRSNRRRLTRTARPRVPPHLPTAHRAVVFGPHRSCGLHQRSPRGEEVVDEHHPPTIEEPSAAGPSHQRTAEVGHPLRRRQPGLVRHRAALTQHRQHTRVLPLVPQLSCGRPRDPQRRVVPPPPHRPTRGGDGDQRHLPGTGAAQRRTHRPRQQLPEQSGKTQNTPFFVREQHRSRFVPIDQRPVDPRQSGRERGRPHPTWHRLTQRLPARLAEAITHQGTPAAGTVSGQNEPFDLQPEPLQQLPHDRHSSSTPKRTPRLWITRKSTNQQANALEAKIPVIRSPGRARNPHRVDPATHRSSPTPHRQHRTQLRPPQSQSLNRDRQAKSPSPTASSSWRPEAAARSPPASPRAAAGSPPRRKRHPLRH